jgi:DNA-binding response OmpR family regulator
VSEGKVVVLVVDDDEMQLDLVARTLRAYDFDVTTCASPIGVTNLVVQVAPQVVLIDVNIPALSGDQLLKLVRKRASEGTVFVLYSASDEGKLRDLAATTGADGWISKSVVGADLAARIRALLSKPQARRGSA